MEEQKWVDTFNSGVNGFIASVVEAMDEGMPKEFGQRVIDEVMKLQDEILAD